MIDIIEQFFGNKQNYTNKLSIQDRIDTLRKYDNELKKYILQIDYQVFLNSLYWKTIVEYLKIKNQHKCIYCGSHDSLVIHHLTYNHHGEEHKQSVMDNDLVCICKHCHCKIHKDKIAESILKIAPNQKVIKNVKVNNNQGEIDLLSNMIARKNLSADAYMLYMELLLNVNGYICALSIKHITNVTSLRERTYYKAVNELIDKGYLVKTPHKQIKEYYLFYEAGFYNKEDTK